MNACYLKTGDLRPYLRRQIISKSTGLPIDVTGATITFSMETLDGLAIVDEAAGVVEDGSEGIIRYEWEAGDTDVAGTYRGEFLVDAGNGNIFSVPQNGYITIIIQSDL